MSGLTRANPAEEAAKKKAAEARLRDGLGATSTTKKPTSKPGPAPVQSVDDASLNKARVAAARTGLPQPVRAPDGHIAYYIDSTGGVIPDAIAQDRLKSTGKPFAPSDQGTPDRGTAKLRQAQAQADANTPAARAAASAAGDANAELGTVWVDGKQLTITSVNPNGSWNATIGQSKERPLAGFLGTTAFDALDTANGSNLSSDTRFTMNAGPADIFTGRTLGDGHGYFGSDGTLGAPNYTPNRPGAANPASAGEYSAGANQASNSTNMMTVGQGLTWLVNLSIKDPGAYQAFVDQLHKANYLSDSQYAAAGGAYSSLVGQAFATAATDTATINGQANGFHTTLFDVLNQRAAAADAAKAKSYTPVQRTFTDPAALEAAARSQAQSDLGRDLTPEEVAQLTGGFHAQEAGMYDQIDAAGRAGKNASVVNPNPTGQVDSFIHDGPMAQEAASWHVAQYGAALRKLFGL